MSLTSRLLKASQMTRVIDGRNSIQSVIKELSNQVTLESGRVLNEAQGILLSEEFDTLFVKDPDALTILTALYNTHEHNGTWKNTLKGSGTESLKNPCISLLIASNETLFEDFVKQKDVEGGFMARTFIVHESKRRGINDLIEEDPNLLNTETLVEELKEMGKIQGEFSWTEEAKDIYRPWYRALATTDFDDKTGSINRLGDSVLKVAMLINLAGKRTLKIEPDDLTLSIEKCSECLMGVKKITRSSGISDISPALRRVTDRLVEAPNCCMTRTALMKKIYPDVDAAMLTRVIETLEETDSVQVIRDDKNKVAYRLTKNAIHMLTRFAEEEK